MTFSFDLKNNASVLKLQACQAYFKRQGAKLEPVNAPSGNTVTYKVIR